MHLRQILTLLVAMVLSTGITYGQKKEIPKDAAKILQAAESFELYSLDPDNSRRGQKPKNNFHGWKVLGKTKVNKADRDRLLKALDRGIQANPGVVAGCFNPRHGIRATLKKETVDLVICFQCYSLQVFHGKDDVSVLTTGLPAPTFNKILTTAKVPLPKQPED